MKTRYETVLCRLKPVRQAKGYSQSQLAHRVGVKRQAIYDIESGKYVPNTVLALRLAKLLGCTVEALFEEAGGEKTLPLILAEPLERQNPRVLLARVRNRLVGYPLSGSRALNDGFRSADGLLRADGGSVDLLCSGQRLDNSVMLLGCDPAFSILAAHVSRKAPEVRIQCRFASSHRALSALAAGHAHMAGTHLHNTEAGEANVALAKRLLGDTQATVVSFSHIEEGLMVAPGNPHGIRGVKDLANGRVRLVNREPGAALRTLLDDCLRRCEIPETSVTGYHQEVSSHLEGAHRVTYRLADAALGLRAIASAQGLDFVPIETVRCDLVVPEDLLDHPAIQVILDLLQSRKLREELQSLPGYGTSRTGTVIAG
jgi:putative molybdopterin biosynthesis protein